MLNTNTISSSSKGHEILVVSYKRVRLGRPSIKNSYRSQKN